MVSVTCLSLTPSDGTLSRCVSARLHVGKLLWGTKAAGWRVFLNFLGSGRGIPRGCGRRPARGEGGSCIAVAEICSAVSEICSAVFEICSTVSGKCQRRYKKNSVVFIIGSAGFWNTHCRVVVLPAGIEYTVPNLQHSF